MGVHVFLFPVSVHIHSRSGLPVPVFVVAHVFNEMVFFCQATLQQSEQNEVRVAAVVHRLVELLLPGMTAFVHGVARAASYGRLPGTEGYHRGQILTQFVILEGQLYVVASKSMGIPAKILNRLHK